MENSTWHLAEILWRKVNILIQHFLPVEIIRVKYNVWASLALHAVQYCCSNVCINLIDYGLDKDSCLQDSSDIDKQQADFVQMQTKEVEESCSCYELDLVQIIWTSFLMKCKNWIWTSFLVKSKKTISATSVHADWRKFGLCRKKELWSAHHCSVGLSAQTKLQIFNCRLNFLQTRLLQVGPLRNNCSHHKLDFFLADFKNFFTFCVFNKLH